MDRGAWRARVQGVTESDELKQQHARCVPGREGVITPSATALGSSFSKGEVQRDSAEEPAEPPAGKDLPQCCRLPIEPLLPALPFSPRGLWQATCLSGLLLLDRKWRNNAIHLRGSWTWGLMELV